MIHCSSTSKISPDTFCVVLEDPAMICKQEPGIELSVDDFEGDQKVVTSRIPYEIRGRIFVDKSLLISENNEAPAKDFKQTLLNIIKNQSDMECMLAYQKTVVKHFDQELSVTVYAKCRAVNCRVYKIVCDTSPDHDQLSIEISYRGEINHELLPGATRTSKRSGQTQRIISRSIKSAKYGLAGEVYLEKALLFDESLETVTENFHNELANAVNNQTEIKCPLKFNKKKFLQRKEGLEIMCYGQCFYESCIKFKLSTLIRADHQLAQIELSVNKEVNHQGNEIKERITKNPAKRVVGEHWVWQKNYDEMQTLLVPKSIFFEANGNRKENYFREMNNILNSISPEKCDFRFQRARVFENANGMNFTSPAYCKYKHCFRYKIFGSLSHSETTVKLRMFKKSGTAHHSTFTVLEPYDTRVYSRGRNKKGSYKPETIDADNVEYHNDFAEHMSPYEEKIEETFMDNTDLNTSIVKTEPQMDYSRLAEICIDKVLLFDETNNVFYEEFYDYLCLAIHDQTYLECPFEFKDLIISADEQGGISVTCHGLCSYADCVAIKVIGFINTDEDKVRFCVMTKGTCQHSTFEQEEEEDDEEDRHEVEKVCAQFELDVVNAGNSEECEVSKNIYVNSDTVLEDSFDSDSNQSGYAEDSPIENTHDSSSSFTNLSDITVRHKLILHKGLTSVRDDFAPNLSFELSHQTGLECRWIFTNPNLYIDDDVGLKFSCEAKCDLNTCLESRISGVIEDESESVVLEISVQGNYCHDSDTKEAHSPIKRDTEEEPQTCTTPGRKSKRYKPNPKSSPDFV